MAEPLPGYLEIGAIYEGSDGRYWLAVGHREAVTGEHGFDWLAEDEFVEELVERGALEGDAEPPFTEVAEEWGWEDYDQFCDDMRELIELPCGSAKNYQESCPACDHFWKHMSGQRELSEDTLYAAGAQGKESTNEEC